MNNNKNISSQNEIINNNFNLNNENSKKDIPDNKEINAQDKIIFSTFENSQMQYQSQLQSLGSEEQLQPVYDQNKQEVLKQPNSTLNSNNFYENSFFNETSINNTNNDDELLKAFIGKNYDKITTRFFNFSGLFFSTFYLFYRKMYLYGILLFITNLILFNMFDNFLITLIFNIIIFFSANKLYLYYAKRKIKKIKYKNSKKSIEEIKNICSLMGGTSIKKVFFGFCSELIIIFITILIIIFTKFNGNFTTFFDKLNIVNLIKNKNLVENVIIDSYSCSGPTYSEIKCNVWVKKDNNVTDYILKVNNKDLFLSLSDYSNYTKLNIYYTQKNKEKTIIDYEIYSKFDNKNISNVSSENELRKKLKLYSIGTHTDTLKLTKIGTEHSGAENGETFTYINYTFVDNRNYEYEMIYKNPSNSLNLIIGNKYTITFEAVEETFYKYDIKKIK